MVLPAGNIYIYAGSMTGLENAQTTTTNKTFYSHTNVFCHRKCDLPECKKCSALWTVFRGCGHSFHVECLLPDLSTCTICQATLLSKIEVLGKTANDAVLTNVDFHSTEDDDDETSEDDDSESDDETETEYCDNEPQDIHILLRRISLWQRAQVPQQ